MWNTNSRYKRDMECDLPKIAKNFDSNSATFLNQRTISLLADDILPNQICPISNARISYYAAIIYIFYKI